MTSDREQTLSGLRGDTVKRKTPAQLDREISDIMSSPPAVSSPPSSSHSAKAMGTIKIMGTTPAQWRLTPIRWIEEERDVVGLVTCPTCHGSKFVRFADGLVVQRPRGDVEYAKEARSESFRSGRLHGNCPTCAKRKGGWGMIPQGKVAGVVRAVVQVGYPDFPPGTVFDSRFHGGTRCNLCNKTVLKSGRVPVHAVGDGGVTHGMWVGEDCARKFLDVKIKRPKTSVMEG